MTSSVCVHELIHLYQIGKLPFKKGANAPKSSEVLEWLDEMGIEVVLADKRHLQCYSELALYADRIPLVNSDRKFSRYGRYGLDFIYNER